MITAHQSNPFSTHKTSKNVYSIFQRIDSVVAPKNEYNNRTVRKVGFICEAENEQEARLGIVHLAANHAAKTGENVLTLFNPQEEAA
jgi:hypothetical protein